MGLRYKQNILELLKQNGYTTYKIRKDNLLSESTVHKLRQKQGVDWKNLEKICSLTHMQPGDFLEYVEE